MAMSQLIVADPLDTAKPLPQDWSFSYSHCQKKRVSRYYHRHSTEKFTDNGSGSIWVPFVVFYSEEPSRPVWGGLRITIRGALDPEVISEKCKNKIPDYWHYAGDFFR